MCPNLYVLSRLISLRVHCSIIFFLYNDNHGYAGPLSCVPSGIILHRNNREQEGKYPCVISGLSEKNVRKRLCSSPDDHDDAIEDIVGVLDVAEGPVDQNLQQHLQGEQAGEHDVTDLQRVGQLIRLETETKRGEWLMQDCGVLRTLLYKPGICLVFSLTASTLNFFQHDWMFTYNP